MDKETSQGGQIPSRIRSVGPMNTCVGGRCGHQPYDPRCSDPDYEQQRCCRFRVHRDDLGSDDELYHSETCPVFA